MCRDLYGMLYQVAGEYSSTFAVTDLSVTDPFGTSWEKIVPNWNQKYWMDSAADLVIEIET